MRFTRLLVMLLFVHSPMPAQGQSQDAREQTAASATVPAGTVLHIRLRQTVSSFGSKQDDPVFSVLIQPVKSGDDIVLPLNAEVQGTITRVRRVGIGFANETALLTINFQSILLPDGSRLPLEGVLVAVDNSRERVDSDGAIHGIRATASASKVISGLAISAASLDPMSQLFCRLRFAERFSHPESEIILPVGTELTYVTTAPISISRKFAGPPEIPQQRIPANRLDRSDPPTALPHSNRQTRDSFGPHYSALPRLAGIDSPRVSGCWLGSVRSLEHAIQIRRHAFSH